MSDAVAPGAPRRHEHYDPRAELGLLQEKVEEALMEARQSTNFCRMIQHDIGKFVRSEQLARGWCADAVGGGKIHPQLLASVDGHLSEFEGFIIARVREELERKIAKEFAARLDSCSQQIDRLYQEQREQEGKLRFLVMEAALKISEVRKEVKGYVSKMWGHVMLIEEKLRLVPAASCTKPEGATVPEDELATALREAMTVLTLLSEGLETERKMNWEENQRWMLFMGRAAEKLRQLGERDEVLATNCQEIWRVTKENRRRCKEAMACVVDLGRRLGPLSSASTAAVATLAREGPQAVRSKAEIVDQKQLRDFTKELHEIGAALRALQVDHARFKKIVGENMVIVTQLQQNGTETVAATNSRDTSLEFVNRKQESCGPNYVFRFPFREENESEENLFIGRNDISLAKRWQASYLTKARLLHGRTCNALRRRVFQSWLAWRRGRRQAATGRDQVAQTPRSLEHAV
ncbi:uncharacterized protein Tco025E_08497 [Trypanosoma conorhini]|uniref:Uncharacterized protein n=1 Tax=Trypanosoma conorhini TaxID=83891 RepID=A0A3R7MGZ0_9TRYP|nr:uncharacterized protein Tco025E_08497 [Trypanosoma conorhini]RNF02326.1 hypothetical protein Tco025E_08497 [Trypanosoma conorhini]